MKKKVDFDNEILFYFAITVRPLYVCLYSARGGSGTPRIIYIINKKIMSRSTVLLVVAFCYLVFFMEYKKNSIFRFDGFVFYFRGFVLHIALRIIIVFMFKQHFF